MDFNKMLSKAGSSIVTVTVFLFALFLIINFPTGYFFVCLILPIGFIMMTGMFTKMSSGGDGIGGRLALVAWCVYFLPIGILSFIHFRKD